jgi:hypothetical protein
MALTRPPRCDMRAPLLVVTDGCSRSRARWLMDSWNRRLLSLLVLAEARFSRRSFSSGCTPHWYLVHQERSKETHSGKPCPPAIASGLTDHVWSVAEGLHSTVAPALRVQPQRRGQPLTQMEQHAISTNGQKHSSSSRPFVSCGFTVAQILTELSYFCSIYGEVSLEAYVFLPGNRNRV